ncbi:putative RNA-directed DNA polymerase from transposon X-element [Collichthys lucidus]|uniref:Putative RNA-directed DNA polymerase from transposon X-element n=1 Tax=Collichthys lucidus TaxID=240159 RepID=A0A4U5TWP2_COLLU|nr:putative RNA-directed DNA polymerase from transposon X-element [Collichthys lucidus]
MQISSVCTLDQIFSVTISCQRTGRLQNLSSSFGFLDFLILMELQLSQQKILGNKNQNIQSSSVCLTGPFSSEVSSTTAEGFWVGSAPGGQRSLTYIDPAHCDLTPDQRQTGNLETGALLPERPEDQNPPELRPILDLHHIGNHDNQFMSNLMNLSQNPSLQPVQQQQAFSWEKHPCTEDNPPCTEDNPPALKTTPPALKTTPPVLKTTPPALKTTPPALKTTPPALKTTPPPDDQVSLSPASVRRSLSRINARRAAGPDNIPGRVLKDCAEELTDVLTDTFNTSLSQAVVPTCFKYTTIIPVPKNASTSCFNDYRPVALTPTIMKCFERLVMQHIKSVLRPSLDPYQFAYRANRSTDDAITTALHSALTHLDSKDSYVRKLFLDFSSAFNTIIPQQLIQKLDCLGLNTSLCNWLLDFLTGRPQTVRVGSNASSTITPNTGAPQRCVLSPLLFTPLTHDCSPTHTNLFVKFADDTTVVAHQQKR